MVAYSSFGTLLKVGDTDGGGGSFTTIAQVLDISGPEKSVDTEDITSHSSAGGYEEIIPTIKRSGEVTFDVLLDPSHATHDSTTGLNFLLDNRKLRGFRMALPTTPAFRWAFLGYVIKLGTAAAVAGTLRMPVTVKVTGAPVLEAGS